jgi:hypothetical protein
MEIGVKDNRSVSVGTKSLVMAVMLVLALIAGCTFRACCVTFVDNYQIGYKYDRATGKIEILGRKGYIVTPPVIVDVHTIDGRPMQVCISAIQRVLNCKLVEFDPKGLELFLSWHGRANYSNSGGTRESPTQFNQILMAYAYDGSGKSYPFLHVISEIKPEDTATEAPK